MEKQGLNFAEFGSTEASSAKINVKDHGTEGDWKLSSVQGRVCVCVVWVWILFQTCYCDWPWFTAIICCCEYNTVCSMGRVI